MYCVFLGVTRDNEKGIDLFLANNGFSFVMRAMQSDVEKLKIKSAFLLSSVCTDNNKCKGKIPSSSCQKFSFQIVYASIQRELVLIVN